MQGILRAFYKERMLVENNGEDNMGISTNDSVTESSSLEKGRAKTIMGTIIREEGR